MLSHLSVRITLSLGVQMLCSPVGASDRPNPAPVQAVTNDYYGTKVVDPYRWMENGKDPRWMPWLKAEATAACHALDAIPARDRFLASATALSGDLVTVQKVVAVGQTHCRPFELPPRLPDSRHSFMLRHSAFSACYIIRKVVAGWVRPLGLGSHAALSALAEPTRNSRAHET